MSAKLIFSLLTIFRMSQTLKALVESELTIKKSRFIGCVQPMADRSAAIAQVNALRQQHPGAAHVCWALLAGGQSAANDDGEPSGTAGRPMLEVMRHQHLDGVLATVVRYFGGIKLGAGGLVRAYTDAVAQAVLLAHEQQLLQPLHRMHTLACSVPYPLEGWVRRELQANLDVTLLSVEHASVVSLCMSVPEDQLLAWRQRLEDGCQGRLAWLQGGQNVN